MIDKELIQQALEALESENPDIQMRAAIALRQALETEPEPLWTQAHWTKYEQGVVDAERMKILKLLREQRKFWKDWEYPEEYIFAVDVLTERIKCKPTSK